MPANSAHAKTDSRRSGLRQSSLSPNWSTPKNRPSTEVLNLFVNFFWLPTVSTK